MKKVISFLLLLASISFQTAFAEIYSINIGSTSNITDDGQIWYPYADAGNFSSYYGDAVFFGVSADTVIPGMVSGTGFLGYAYSTSDSMLGWIMPLTSGDRYSLTAYTDTDLGMTPALSTYSYVLGSIGSVIASGTEDLGGHTYQYVTYSAIASDDSVNEYVFASYSGLINAVKITPVPEPATLVLLGTGLAIAGTLSRRRLSARS